VDDPADAPEGATLRRPAEEALRSTTPPKAWLWEVVEPTQTPQFLLYRRLVGVGLGHVTGGALGLLATPTSTSGTISGDAFLSRLGQHRRLACNPRVRDLRTALLRIEPADRDGVLRSITSGSVHEGLTLLLAEPQWRREVARLRGGFTTVNDERADAAVWQSVDPPQGAPDDPVCGWLNTRSLVEHWGDHGFRRALKTGATADLTMWALTLPSHPDLVATHLQPELTRWVDEADADISGVLTALALSRRPFSGPASSALVWAAGFRNTRTRSAAAEAIGTAVRHGTLAGHDLGRELLAVLGPNAGPFPMGDSYEVLQPPLSRVMKTLTDASRLNDHAGFAVLAAVTELLGVAPDLKGGFAVVELAAQLAERYRVHVDLPAPLAAIASSRSSSRTAQEARRLAAAGRGVSG